MNDMLIYMDCCCLNRPNDDQTIDKIRIESDVIIAILFKCFYGSWQLIGSDIIEYEITKTPDINKRNKILDIYKIKKENIEINDTIIKRAKEIQLHGIESMDSLHFASAEFKRVNVLLTVDKNFINNSKRINSSLQVVNPINWFMEEIEND
jgi:hypothetical protein